MYMSNIIKFPIEKIDHQRTIDAKMALEVQLQEAEKHRFIERQVERYGTGILKNLHKQGFDIDDESFLEDYIFVMESFKSCLLRCVDLEHPLQKIQHKLHELLEEDNS